MAKVPVSILIPAKNEASNISRCLAAVSWADEIVVVDSHSTDGTPDLARRSGATVVQFDFNGIWPKKKNWALETVPFRNEWVFILDADEVMPPDSEAEFARILAADGAGRNGYWINRRFMFMGRWLRHAYYPNWNLRLFRRRLGRYERLVEGATRSGDNEVHEHLVVDGAIGHLACEMDHYAFPSVEVFIEKHNRYSNWEARLAVEDGLGRKTSDALQSPKVRLRRLLKSASRRLPFRPTLRFLYVYVAQGGFLDGREGYYFARLHGAYELMALAKTAELRKALAAKMRQNAAEASAAADAGSTG
jgi:glycosyltransferase involved in cell wall biosynthesis